MVYFFILFYFIFEILNSLHDNLIKSVNRLLHLFKYGDKFALNRYKTINFQVKEAAIVDPWIKNEKWASVIADNIWHE